MPFQMDVEDQDYQVAVDLSIGAGVIFQPNQVHARLVVATPQRVAVLALVFADNGIDFSVTCLPPSPPPSPQPLDPEEWGARGFFVFIWPNAIGVVIDPRG